METGSRIMVAGPGGGRWEGVVNGSRVSVLEDEMFWRERVAIVAQ